MFKLCKKINILQILILFICIFNCLITFSENKLEVNDIVYNVNPYYNYWNNEFIIYVDNYQGDVNNVSKNDLKGGKGTSYVYFFTKLTNGTYNYDILLDDINNTSIGNNLHDKKPILVHLPKSASTHESHALLKSDDEIGKLVSGGPYSKYKNYKNGFYYKNELLDKDKLNKILNTYKIESDKIDDMLKQIKTLSIKDIYPTVNVAYMTNGATNVAGTPDAKIYLLNLDKKLNPYNLLISDVTTNNIISGSDTNNYLSDWQVETMYIYDKDNKIIETISFDSFRQLLWSKQDKSLLDWYKSLNH